MTQRFFDMAYNTSTENRTGEEVKTHIVEKLKALNGGD